jgi:glycosyltransferase involved in cell wall biosynthesis
MFIKMKKPAILIPAYNEGKYIKDVILECRRLGNDIIVVDDGSTDNTGEILQSFTDLPEPRVIIIEHEINKGKGEALKTGFQCAVQNEYCGVVTIDADGQHKVSEIADFLNALEKNSPDVIVGSRLNNSKGMPFIRLATNVFTSWLISVIAGKRINDVQSGFRYIGYNVLKNIKLETKNFDTEPEILLKASWMDYKIINIPISTIYHKDFISHVSPFKDTLKFFKLIFKSLGWKKRFRRSHTRA